MLYKYKNKCSVCSFEAFTDHDQINQKINVTLCFLPVTTLLPPPLKHVDPSYVTSRGFYLHFEFRKLLFTITTRVYYSSVLT